MITIRASMVVLFSAMAPGQELSKSDLTGRWAGAMVLEGAELAVSMRVEADGDGIFAVVDRSVRLDARASGTAGSLVVDLLSDGVVDARLEGRIAEQVFVGSCIRGNQVWPIALRRTVPVTTAALEKLAGNYTLQSGETIVVHRLRRMTDEVLVCAFSESGRRRILYPVGDLEFVAGASFAAADPIQARLVFRRSQDGDQLTISASDGAVLVAKRRQAMAETFPALPGVAVQRREVTIDAGDVELRGTLYLPPLVSGPYPAVVQTHGSGQTTRQRQWFYYTSVALRCGLAVLAYDKRGCGESGGVFEPFTVQGSAALFDRLAGDAAAALRWLRRQDGIDPDRVGLIGGSQAGWIIPLAAKRGGVAFGIIGCGPAVSAGEEEYHSAMVDAESIAIADAALAEWEGPRGYDPRAVLAENRTPLLWIFGFRDGAIPTRASISVLEGLRRGGNQSHTLHVIPDSNHDFVNPLTGEGFLLEPVITAWLRQQGLLPD